MIIFIRLQRKIASLADKSFRLIDCWDFKAALGFMAYKNALGRQALRRGDTQARDYHGNAQEGYRRAGGSLRRTGLYPISDEIKEKLRSFLNSA
jgi:hypothetical protein